MTLDPKIRPDHFRRTAVVYVRQSTLHQVRGNRESGARQYALVERAKTLGWPATAVQTIDEDQGRSGARAGRTARRSADAALWRSVGVRWQPRLRSVTSW
jgi:hypothetical protein